MSPRPGQPDIVSDIQTIGRHSIEDLVKQYEDDLFRDFLPFLEKYVIDHERGGFMTNVDRDGTSINTVKNTWYCGRGAWAYSYLYNTLDKNPRYLEIAGKTLEFVMKHEPQGDTFWTPEFTKEGEPIALEGQFIGGKYYPVNQEVSGDLFIANALQEYAHAARREDYWRKAKDIVAKCVRVFDRPDYAPNAPQVYIGKDAPPLPGGRIMGVWMLLMNVTTQMLEKRPGEADLARLNDRCLDAVLERHYNPDYDLLNEVLQHDFRRSDPPYRDLVYTGHSIETLWMILYEARRRKDPALWSRAERLFRRNLDVAWDRVFGGFFRGIKDVPSYSWILDKPLWTQEEALIGTLFLIEHSGSPWAREWFERAYDFIHDKYSLRKHGLPLYDDWPDRRVTFVRHHTRVEIFHHARHLMQNLVALRRILERGKKISGEFQ